jgi:hypothetical protein
MASSNGPVDAGSGLFLRDTATKSAMRWGNVLLWIQQVLKRETAPS